MAERPAEKPVLQKPPGYRDPAAPLPARPPPRKTPLPPAFRQAGKPPPRRRGVPRHCCRRLCCWLIVVLVSASALLAAVAALSYLWFQPRLPAFRVESIQTSRFNVSARSDGTYLDAAASVRVQAANPNAKIALAYGDSEASISVADEDGDVEIGSASASGFVQGKKNSTVMKFGTSVSGVLVDDAVGSRLKARFKSKEIKYAVEIRTKVGVRVRGKATGEMPIRVVCGAVSLRMVERRAALQPKCDIILLKWINLH